MRVLLLIIGLVGVGVFVLGPDTSLGPAALVVGVALVGVSGTAWLVRERRREKGAPSTRGDGGRADPPI